MRFPVLLMDINLLISSCQNLGKNWKALLLTIIVEIKNCFSEVETESVTSYTELTECSLSIKTSMFDTSLPMLQPC